MNKKEKGFSLIEILVVLGIIGILSTFLTPKISNYLALGKETKLIATLDSLRTASEMYQIEKGEALGKEKLDKNLTKEDMEKLKGFFSNGYKDLIKDVESTSNDILYEIGGSRAESKDNNASEEIVYGGKVKFTFKAPEGETSDGVKIWVTPEDNVGPYTMKGIKWGDL